MARNAFGLALLVSVAGCSHQKEEKAAQAKATALRVRTDSLRKARHVADCSCRSGSPRAWTRSAPS